MNSARNGARRPRSLPWLILAVLATAAVLGYLYWPNAGPGPGTGGETSAGGPPGKRGWDAGPGGPGGGRDRPVPVVTEVARIGDLPVYLWGWGRSRPATA